MKDSKSPDMIKFLDETSSLLFGQSRSSALRTKTCVFCCKDASEFVDALSLKEFGISGMCQECQDGIFDNGEYPEDPKEILDIDPRF